MRRVSARPDPGAARRGKAPARRRPRARWRTALPLWGGALGALAAVGGGGAWLWHGGWIERGAAAAAVAAVEATADAGFRLREVLVSGRVETSAETLAAALRLRTGEPLLALDPDAIRRRVDALPWVKSAVVERRLPDVLYVEIEEHVALALWQRAGRSMLIARDGAVVAAPDLGRFAGLLLVVGDDAPPAAAELVDMLAREPDLRRRVLAAARVAGRRWNLRLDNGVEVRLPEEDAAAAWSRLAGLEREHRLLERDLTAVDLRLPDRLVVRLTPDAAARRRNPGNNT